MRATYVISLAVVLLLLSGYYVLFERGSTPRSEKTKPAILIFLLSPGDIKALRVVTSDGRELFCERTGDSWRLWKGTETEAFQSTLDDFVAALLATQQIDRFVPARDAPGEYGMDPPSHTITVTDRTDKDYQLLLGTRTPTRTCLYARFAESRDLLVVGALLKWEVEKIEPLLAAASKP